MNAAWVSARLDEIARFGKGERGFSRLVFGDAECGAVQHVAALMHEAGLHVRSDAFGNVIGRLDGTVSHAPVVATGSHLDTVPEGGNFDGVAGVVAGLGAVLRLRDRGRRRHPVEIIVFRGEESSRFSIHTLGSKVMAGIADIERWRTVEDQAGQRLAEVLAARGLDIEQLPGAARRVGELKAFVELHIEQGSVLQEAGVPIGVVEAIAAPVRLKITVSGTASHSGTTPMGRRRDALVSASRAVLAVQAEATRRATRAVVGTVGVMKVHPGAMNVVPGRVEMWVDIRGSDTASLADAVEAVRGAVAAIAAEEGTVIDVETVSVDTPVPMDGAILRTIEAASRRLGFAALRMPSGAGHDAMNLARIAPAGMIFIPCRDGVSHNPDEHASVEAICVGVDVLAETLAELAA